MPAAEFMAWVSIRPTLPGLAAVPTGGLPAAVPAAASATAAVHAIHSDSSETFSDHYAWIGDEHLPQQTRRVWQQKGPSSAELEEAAGALSGAQA